METKYTEDKEKSAKYYYELGEIRKKYAEIFKSLNISELSANYSWGVKKDKVIALMEPLDDKIVLDIGCGWGDLLLKVSDKIEQGIGIDISMVNFPKEAPKNLEFLVADAKMHLSFKDNYFDRITLIEVIEHLTPDDAKALLREINRLLKHNGKFILTTPRKKSLSRWLMPFFTLLSYLPIVDPKTKQAYIDYRKSLNKISKKYDMQEHIKEYRYKELENLLNESGFTVTSSTGSTVSPYLSIGVISDFNINEFSPIIFKTWKKISDILTKLSQNFYWDSIVVCEKSKFYHENINIE